LRRQGEALKNVFNLALITHVDKVIEAIRLFYAKDLKINI
jgi:hypothetical protein